MKYVTVILSAILLLTALPSQAQESDSDRKTVDERVDEGIDKGINALEGLFGRKKKKKKKKDQSEPVEEAPASEPASNPSNSGGGSSGNAFMKGMFGGGDVDLPDSYYFKSKLTCLVTNVNRKGKREESRYYSYANHADQLFGMEPESERGEYALVIYDQQEGHMVTLSDNDGEKNAVVISMDIGQMVQNMEGTTTEDDAEVTGTYGNMKKTGRTKTIAGYSAQEWVLESDGNKIEYWISKDASLSGMGLFGGLYQINNQPVNASGWGTMPKGMILEMNMYDKTEQEEVHWQIEKMDLNSNTRISLSGYNVMSLGGADGAGGGSYGAPASSGDEGDEDEY